MDDPLVGRTLGRYRIAAAIGEGGMALVYRAVDPTVGRDVAIKVVHPRLARDPAFVERFMREAQVVARLQHPNILPLYDFGDQDGLAYLVMPLILGGTLADRLRAAINPVAALALLRPVAAALDHAHRQGVIHRDVKPSNILLTPESVPLLADFGIARVVGDASFTRTGLGVGSVNYTAPEQLEGRPADGRTDVYSLGVILYEVLAGRLPYPPRPDDTPFSLALRQLREAAPPPSAVNAALPPEVDAILGASLAADPAKRPATCAALLDGLWGVLSSGGESPAVESISHYPTPTLVSRTPSHRPTSPAPTSDPTPALKVSRRSATTRIALAGGGGLLALCLGGTGVARVATWARRSLLASAAPSSVARAATATPTPLALGGAVPLVVAPPTPTATAMPTMIPSNTPTVTPVPTATATSTVTPTPTEMPTPTEVPTATATRTPLPTSTPTPLPTPTRTATRPPASPIPPTSTPNVFVVDGFASSASGFPKAAAPAKTTKGYAVGYGNNFYFIRVPPSMATLSNDQSATLERRMFRDFTVDAEMSWAANYTSGAYGLVLRDGPDGGYRVLVSTSGAVLVGKNDDTKSYVIRDWQTTYAYRSGTQTNVITVTCNGPTFTIWLNGTFITTFVDTDINYGEIGFQVDAWKVPVEARFTYFRITPPR